MPTTTHPPPHHPPSTHLLLQQGEMVYMISGRLKKDKIKAYFTTYSWMEPKEVVENFIANDSEAVAKRKSTGELINISTHMIGYILSDRRYSDDKAVMQSPILIGYDIRWEYAQSNGHHNIFEDEESIVPLKDLIILNAQELRAEVYNNGGPEKGEQR
jgi:hypothetical protein